MTIEYRAARRTARTSPTTTTAAVSDETRATFERILGLSRRLALAPAECRVAVCLASCPKDAEVPTYQYLQVTDRLLDDFRAVVRTVLDPLAAQWANGDLLLRPYAAETRPDASEIEHLRLDAHPVIARQIAPLDQLFAFNVFEADPAFLADLRYYAIVVAPPEGNPVTFFRTYTPKKELSRSRLFAAFFRDGQFDTVREPLFLFDHYVDCIASGPDMFVLKKGHFQTMFRFFELVRRNAEQALEALRASVPIGNFDAFARDCQSHVLKLVKLQSIAGKPYLASITIADLRKVIHRYGLRVEIRDEAGREVVMYDPADKWALLKLLDDDYLHSIMTDIEYEASGKRPM